MFSFLETGSYVTQIKLEHTLFTEVAGGHPVSGFDNYIYYQDPFVIYNNPDNYYSSTYQQRPTQQPQYESHPQQISYPTQPPQQPVYQPSQQPVYQPQQQPIYQPRPVQTISQPIAQPAPVYQTEPPPAPVYQPTDT